jgi:phage terminase large subunit-like protein
VCPGSVIDEGQVLSELDEVAKCVRILSIAYDPYDSTRFVNLFQAWIANKLRGKVSGKQLEDFLKKTLQPVSQTWASFNASCQVMYDIINWPSQRVWISPNPIIPWCFANCVLDEDRMGNVKPIKRTANSKIDVAICLLMGIIVMEKWKV